MRRVAAILIFLAARLKSEVRRAYADAWLAHQLLRNNLRYLQLVAEMESVTQAAVESGMATGSDVLKAKAESLMFTEQRMDHLHAATAAREELIRLAGPAADALPPYPERLEFTFSVERDACVAFALEHSPELAARLDRVERLRRDAAPAAELEAAVAETEALRLRLRAEVGIALGRLNTLRHHLSLHREHLLPLRDRTVQTLRAEVEAGRRTPMDVLSARRMELDERELDLRHQAEALKVATELDRLAGGAWILDGEE